MFRSVSRVPVRHLRPLLGRQIRFAATASKEEAAKKASFGLLSFLRLPNVQRVIRMGRIVVVTIMVYQVGYQNGMVHFAQDPAQVEDEMMKMSLGIPANDNIKDHIHNENSPLHKHVSKIGNRLIGVAREHCDNQLKNTKAMIQTVRSGGEIKNPNQEPINLNQLLELEAMWARAVKRLEGKWTIVLSRSPEINAFVSGVSPRKIFVYEGLIRKLDLSEDELAMILGHELSHVILGHTEEQVPVTAIILGTQLVMMSLVDPLGLGSFIFDQFVSQMGKYMTASYSRAHEHDADELGLLLTSMACFDIAAGALVHDKLDHASGHRETQLTDTHPSSMERKIILAELARAHETDRLTNPAYSQFQRDCIRKKEDWTASLLALSGLDKATKLRTASKTEKKPE